MSNSNHSSSVKAILYAFLANLGIATAKSVAAVYTASGSMLAEAIHSFADCGNQILLFVGLKQSMKPANVEHPLGYGKATYVWSFIVAIILFSLGGLFSIYEGWHKLHAPEQISSGWIALLVLAVSILLEIGSLIGCLKEIEKVRGSVPFRKWFKTTRNAELVVVLGEDTAAIVGLVIAFGFVAVTVITGNPVYDAAGSICIGVILLFISLFVARRVTALIVGRSAEPELRAAIDKIIGNDENIHALLNSVTLQFGPQIMLAAKLKMRPGMSIDEAVQHINQLEINIKRQIPEVGWCFMEPDIKD